MKTVALLFLSIIFLAQPIAWAAEGHESHGGDDEVLEFATYLNQISAGILQEKSPWLGERQLEVLLDGWRYCPVRHSGNPDRIVQFSVASESCSLRFSVSAWRSLDERDDRWIETCENLVEGLRLPYSIDRCEKYLKARSWPVPRWT